MASAGGAWKSYKSKTQGSVSLFAKSGESTRQTVNRYRKNGYSI